MTDRMYRIGLAIVLVTLMLAGSVLVAGGMGGGSRIQLTAYFDNSTGLYVGDDVRIIGVNVGKITRIEAEPTRVRVDFWVSDDRDVPADANAVILSPGVVSARFIQLTPAYTGGATMLSGTTIPQDRTAVPVEWDEMREQLQTLSDTLQPTEPGGTSTLGALLNTTADNLRGEGANIRDALVKASAAFSALGDHSGDIAATVKSLSLVVSALSGTTDLMGQLNINLAAVSALMANDPDEVATALRDFHTATVAVRDFVEQNKEAFGTATDRATSISQALAESVPDIKQALHIGPNTAQNFTNIYKPAQGAISVIPAINNFSNPIQFICGAIQAASRLGAEQSAKLCVQYLAPIVKNRQYNFLPIGANLLPAPIPVPLVGAMARPNELDYSEDRLRPDFNPAAAPSGATAPSPETVSTDPEQGLAGIMVHGEQP